MAVLSAVLQCRIVAQNDDGSSKREISLVKCKAYLLAGGGEECCSRCGDGEAALYLYYNM